MAEPGQTITPKEVAAERKHSISSSARSSHQDVDETAKSSEAANLELTKTSSEPNYPPTRQVLVIMAGIFVSAFLVALDRLIVGVAIPTITNDFHSLGDVGWYGSAYLLTSCAFALFMGRVFTFYNPKWVFLVTLVIFEIGSAICGAAPNSTALIVGRAIAGLGGAGLFQGAIIIVVYILPLHKRPMWTGFFGMVFGVASAVGPLLGGAFTDGPGWRWCFYINLPLGAVVFLCLIFFLHIPPELLHQKAISHKEQLNRLDPIGTFVFLPTVICLLLALQWGGLVYNWSNARIIALFVLFGVLSVVWVAIQKWKGEYATVPGRIVRNRSIIAGMVFTLVNYSAMMVMVYFIPIWFQAIKGASAVKAGIMNLPLVLGLVIASVMAGILTKNVGYYTPWMIVSAILTPIGAGLISTWTPSTNHMAWIGYQFLYGFGTGFGMQQSSVAAQTVLPRKDVATGASLMMFTMMFGGSIFISVGNNIFDSRLGSGLAAIPGFDVASVVKSGATELRHNVSPEQLPAVLDVYNQALRAPFYLATALASVSIFGALAMEWKSVKPPQKKVPVDGNEAAPLPQSTSEKEAEAQATAGVATSDKAMGKI